MAKILDESRPISPRVQVLHQHKYARLNDSQIFCACGEVVSIAAPAVATPACCHGYHCYHWPNTVQFYPAWQPTWTSSPNWTVTTGGDYTNFGYTKVG